jgi:hypothetical protein
MSVKQPLFESKKIRRSGLNNSQPNGQVTDFPNYKGYHRLLSTTFAGNLTEEKLAK